MKIRKFVLNMILITFIGVLSFASNAKSNELDKYLMLSLEDNMEYFLLVKKTEVTQREWLTVTGKNPSFHKECGLDCPVEGINWFEGLIYLNKLSLVEGLDICYELKNCKEENNEFFCEEVFWNKTCNGYRYPTVIEWEYILASMHINYDKLSEYAWFTENSDKKTHKVAQKKGPIFDLHGNVFEWLWDSSEEENNKNIKHIKGCGYSSGKKNCRIGCTFFIPASEATSALGLRPVRFIAPLKLTGSIK